MSDRRRTFNQTQ